MFSAMYLNISLVNLRLRRVSRAANSILPEASLNYWSKCLNPTRAAFLIHAAVLAVCLYNQNTLYLAIRGIDSSQVKWNNEGSFLNDTHKDLKADFVIANPPFNDSDWSGDLLRKDGRWKYGTPPTGNANYAWIQHFLYHLSPSGIAGFVLAKGSLTSKTSGEGDIRKTLIEARLVDCIINLPAKLFLNTQIPACLWFLSRNKAKREIIVSRIKRVVHINRRF
jgi:type I restriction-modification system DNA methylase subunit